MPVATVSASMPTDLIDALRASAKRSDRSFSAELRIAARAHLDSHNDDGRRAGHATPVNKRDAPARAGG